MVAKKFGTKISIVLKKKNIRITFLCKEIEK
jgi:hypothetical protein